MNLSLGPEVQKLIEEQVTSGKYSSPEEVVSAAVFALDRHQQLGEFESGELDALLAEGERSIEQEGMLDGDEAYRLRCQRRAQSRSSAP